MEKTFVKPDNSAIITKAELYTVLTSLIMHSEQVRWTRLNNFLVVGSIFLLAWAAIFAGADDSEFKEHLLLVFSIPGFLLGLLWARLGWRSSQYMDDFHGQAYDLERQFPENLPKPFHSSEERRGKVKGGIEKITSSKWIVSSIPIIFSLLFLALAVIPYIT